MNTKLPTFLFIHGQFGEHSDFDELINSFSNSIKQSFQFKSIDLPGHGNRDLFLYPKGKIAFIKKLAQEEFDPTVEWIYGYSLGGRIAAELINSGCFPGVKGLFLESSHVLKTNPLESRKKWQFDLENCEHYNDDPYSFFDKWYSAPLWGNFLKTPQGLEASERKMKKLHAQWGHSLLQYSKSRGIGERLDFKGDVYYLTGEQDYKYTKLMKNLPFKNKTFSGVGHNIHLLKKDEVVQFIQSKIL